MQEEEQSASWSSAVAPSLGAMQQSTTATSPLCALCEERDPDTACGNTHFNQEHFSKGVCSHRFCRPCLRTWIETCIADHRRIINCPAPDCHFMLYGDDIAHLAPASAAAYTALCAEDYSVRATQLEAEDPAFAAWVRANTKQCPACHVFVERERGCNSMVCRCGNGFCYRCGESTADPCRCYGRRLTCQEEQDNQFARAYERARMNSIRDTIQHQGPIVVNGQYNFFNHVDGTPMSYEAARFTVPPTVQVVTDACEVIRVPGGFPYHDDGEGDDDYGGYDEEEGLYPFNLFRGSERPGDAAAWHDYAYWYAPNHGRRCVWLAPRGSRCCTPEHEPRESLAWVRSYATALAWLDWRRRDRQLMMQPLRFPIDRLTDLQLATLIQDMRRANAHRLVECCAQCRRPVDPARTWWLWSWHHGTACHCRHILLPKYEVDEMEDWDDLADEAWDAIERRGAVHMRPRTRQASQARRRTLNAK